MKRTGLSKSCLSIAATLGVLSASAARAATVALPDIDITTDAPTTAAAAPIVTAPASAAPAATPVFLQDATPANNTRIDAATIARTASPNVAETLLRAVPSVDLPGQTGNPLLPDVEFRGFVASPVSGTPQGLAVYQNGVRINEAFGDTMNWDMIPTFAIASMDMISNNPAYGLNALGGAVNIKMKDGFSFSGGKLDVSGGSYGRIQAGFEYGKQIDNFAFYGALEAVHDNGYRDLSSSTIRRFYGDLGYRVEGNEVHLSLGLADNLFGAAGPAPVQLLQQDWANVYTTPQTVHNQMGMATLSGKFTLSPTWSLVVVGLCPPLRAACGGRQPHQRPALRRSDPALLQRSDHAGQRTQWPATRQCLSAQRRAGRNRPHRNPHHQPGRVRSSCPTATSCSASGTMQALARATTMA